MVWINRFIKRLVYFLLVFSGCILIVEFSVRVVSIEHFFLPPIEPENYVVADSRKGYDLAKNFPDTNFKFPEASYKVFTNSLGCYDYEFSDNSLSPILFVGDSFTWGWVPLEQNWTKIMSQNLGRRVLSCGVNGYGTKQQLLKTKEIYENLDNKPKLIIVGYLGGNDIDDDRLFPNYSVYKGTRYKVPKCLQNCDDIELPNPGLLQKIKFFLGKNSVIYNSLKKMSFEVYARKVLVFIFPDKLLIDLKIIRDNSNEVLLTKDDQNRLPDEHVDNIVKFLDFAKKNKSAILFVLIPSKQDFLSQDYSNKITKDFLMENNIPYLDLYPEFKKIHEGHALDLYWKIDGHWNALGNEFAGLVLTKYLVEENYFKKDKNNFDVILRERFLYEKN